MFIQEVIYKIWENVTEEYNQSYKQMMSLTASDVYNEILKSLEVVDLLSLNGELFRMTNLITTGCPNCILEDRLGGCSFCDYYSNYASEIAKVNVLKKKDPKLYAKVVTEAFTQTRAKVKETSLVEYISGHDSLNPHVLTDDILNSIFSGKNQFQRKSFYCFCETRANNITLERLIKWKENIGKKISNRLVVEFGVEVQNQWLRNHWLNKQILNKQIVKAIATIKEAGIHSGASILIGIPGLTDAQSLAIFEDTYLFLAREKTDHIICLPLIKKNVTLQNFIYQKLNGIQELTEMGITKRKHTGVPSIFMVFDAVCNVMEKAPESLPNIILGPVYFPPYYEEITGILDDKDEQKVAMQIMAGLDEFNIGKNIGKLFELKKVIKATKYYQSYREKLQQEKQLNEIPETLQILGKAIAEELWEKSWEDKIEQFQSELESYEYANYPSRV